MKKIRILKKNLSMVIRENRSDQQLQKVLACILVITILVLSLGSIQGTFGLFSRSFFFSDSAQAAKYDVVITAPEEFWSEQDESVFEYYFLSEVDIQALVFQITNNGDIDIICRPNINADIKYRIYVAEEECTEFIVETKETVSFWLIIAPNGLDTNISNSELFIDIQQLEG